MTITLEGNCHYRLLYRVLDALNEAGEAYTVRVTVKGRPDVYGACGFLPINWEDEDNVPNHLDVEVRGANEDPTGELAWVDLRDVSHVAILCWG